MGSKIEGIDGPEKKVCGVFLVSSEQCITNLWLYLGKQNYRKKRVVKVGSVCQGHSWYCQFCTQPKNVYTKEQVSFALTIN